MKTTDMPVIKLGGSPHDRGRAYGKTAKSLIATMVNHWRDNLNRYREDTASALDPDSYLNEFFSQTHYVNAIQRWTPDLWEEVQGIAEGSGQTVDNILGLQLIDEEWVFGLRRKLDKPTSKCTAFGVPDAASGLSYAGQNMDIPSWVDGCQVLLRVMPTENSPEALIFSVAGSLGLNGLNASGLGITCNTLTQLNASSDGLPVLFIIRSILAMNTIDQAEKFLHTIPHASGQNYILSSPADMRCFECCGTSVVSYNPAEWQGRVFHSNHPLVNPDTSELSQLTLNRLKNTEARLASISHRLGDISQSPTLDDVKSALAAHDDPHNPVSRNNTQDGNPIGFTAGSSIYELGAQPRLHLAAGPPCETPFEIFDFTHLKKGA